MSFLNNIKVDFERENTVKNIFSKSKKGIRLCEPLQIDTVHELSVQASSFHCCTPKELIPLDNYTTFEMAILRYGNIYKDLSLFEDFPYFEQLKSYYQDNGVFIYVPKTLIEKFYNWLMNDF